MLPTWHYWALTLLVLPLAGIAFLLISYDYDSKYPFAAMLLIAASGTVLARERAVRRMPCRRRAGWTAIGCVLATTITGVGGYALLVILYILNSS